MLLDISVPRADVYRDSKIVSGLHKIMDVERTVERAVVGDVVYQQNTHCTAVVSGGDSAEAFLTGGVPLEWDEEIL